jgi:hypothetical protein
MCSQISNKDIGEIIAFLNQNLSEVPGANHFIEKLKNRRNEDDFIHAQIIKRIFESNKFKITGIDLSLQRYNDDKGINEKFDIDIELNNEYYIQIWHGASYSSHRVKEIMDSSNSYSGGVPSDFLADSKNIDKKMRQLPNNNLGVVICYPRYGLGLDILPSKIPKNKAFVEIMCVEAKNGISELAGIFISEDFNYQDVVIAIVKSAGFTLRNPPL